MRHTLPILLFACGVPDGALMSELDADQLADVCSEVAPREVQCDGEVERTFAVGCDGDDVVSAACVVTVGQVRDCHEAIALHSDAEICAAEGFPADCDALLSEDCLPG